jgi:tubulin polyglutamylase TTLL4
VTHFPGTWELGRKDKLYRNVGKFRRSHGAVFDIVPRHFVLPRDTDEWRAEYERLPHLVYILKPCCSSRGRGIRVLKKPSDVPREKDGTIKECLVQRYITNPHLIDGFKYDLRLYVVVTCFDPLRVYLYHEGLVRFATVKYSSDEKTLRKRCMHLTNYSINSKKAGFEMNMDQEEDGVGSKWSITALKKWFEKEGLDFNPVWEQVRGCAPTHSNSLMARNPRGLCA